MNISELKVELLRRVNNNLSVSEDELFGENGLGILRMDEDGVCFWVNESDCELSGERLEDIENVVFMICDELDYEIVC